jgi:microcystin-dependent protein
MAEPFVAEIRILANTYAPRGWAQCNGQLMPISQNTALFSLLGTFFGGDGKTTFALPDIQGSATLHQGQSTTGSEYFLGETSGAPQVTLLQSEMPAHPHFLQAGSDDGDLKAPTPTRVLARSTGGFLYGTDPSNKQAMAATAVGFAGGNTAHNNMMPSLVLNFCIALQGVYPSRP